MKLYLLTLTFSVLFKSVLATEVSITLGPTKYIRRKKENNIEECVLLISNYTKIGFQKIVQNTSLKAGK